MNNTPAINELELVEKDLIDKLQSVRDTLEMLRGMYSVSGKSAIGNVSTEKYADFDTNASFREKFLLVLKKENRFLHVREIANIIHALEPNLTVKQILGKLSPTITYFRNQKAIVKVVVGKSHFNTFWGSKNWIDSEGNPKEQHMYDMEQVNNSRKKEEIDI